MCPSTSRHLVICGVKSVSLTKKRSEIKLCNKMHMISNWTNSIFSYNKVFKKACREVHSWFFSNSQTTATDETRWALYECFVFLNFIYKHLRVHEHLTLNIFMQRQHTYTCNSNHCPFLSLNFLFKNTKQNAEPHTQSFPPSRANMTFATSTLPGIPSHQQCQQQHLHRATNRGWMKWDAGVPEMQDPLPSKPTA